MTVKDEQEKEEEETRCTNLQSQSSIITVDPPSLPHEEEEETGEASEDLMPRGPVTGKPTSYRPNNEVFNHISNKSYSSHSLDRFHTQAAPFSPQLPSPQQPRSQAVGGFVQNGFPQGAYYSMAPQINAGRAPVYNNVNMGTCAMATSNGKRVMDDDEDNPYKYTRPVEEKGYGVLQTDCNNLSGGLKSQPTYSQVSCKLGCGGQVGSGMHSCLLVVVFYCTCVRLCVCVYIYRKGEVGCYLSVCSWSKDCWLNI